MYVDLQCIYYKEKKTIENIIQCPICIGVVLNPKQCCKCESLYCATCIEQWKKKSDSCPICKEVINMKEMSRLTKQLFSNLLFTCPSGQCEETITYDNLINHPCSKLKIKFINCPCCSSLINEKNLHLPIDLQKENDDLKKELVKLKEINHNLILKLNDLLEIKIPSKIQSDSKSLVKDEKENFKLDVYADKEIFKYQIFSDDICPHEKSNSCPIFDCCNKAYPCKNCHNNSQNHKIGKIMEVYCKSCRKINNKNNIKCHNCGIEFFCEIIFKNDLSLKNNKVSVKK